LNVKFNVIAMPKTFLFISAGLSTYLMKHEKYSFIFSATSSQKTWEHDVPRNYYFGVVNMSAGMEKYISRHLALQAEPFLKVPLKSIGDGGVLLRSGGIFLGIKYTFY
jgi:hypothetical protein